MQQNPIERPDPNPQPEQVAAERREEQGGMRRPVENRTNAELLEALELRQLYLKK